MSSLARKVVDVIITPVQTKIIEEVKPPRPPDTQPPPPPLDFAPPPSSFVPPPEVRITTPPPTAPTITAVPPPPPVTISPTLPAAPPAPSLDFNKCGKPEYNAAATRAGVTGTVVVSYVMDADGRISETEVERSAGPSREHKMLDRLTVDAITKCHGRPGAVDGVPEKLRGSVAYEWKLD